MKFECQESCGAKCCKPYREGQPGFVFLTNDDMVRLINFLKIPGKTFAMRARFFSTRFKKTKTVQWFLKKNERDECMFLKNGKCTVYEARPTQCRTFPFWPELMSGIPYKELKDFCPGVGKGNEITHHLLDEQVKADEELCKF